MQIKDSSKFLAATLTLTLAGVCLLAAISTASPSSAGPQNLPTPQDIARIIIKTKEYIAFRVGSSVDHVAVIMIQPGPQVQLADGTPADVYDVEAKTNDGVVYAIVYAMWGGDAAGEKLYLSAMANKKILSRIARLSLTNNQENDYVVRDWKIVGDEVVFIYHKEGGEPVQVKIDKKSGKVLADQGPAKEAVAVADAREILSVASVEFASVEEAKTSMDAWFPRDAGKFDFVAAGETAPAAAEGRIVLSYQLLDNGAVSLMIPVEMFSHELSPEIPEGTRETLMRQGVLDEQRDTREGERFTPQVKEEAPATAPAKP